MKNRLKLLEIDPLLAPFEGDIRLLRMMTEGTWTDEEFCICPPRHRVEAEYTGKKYRLYRWGPMRYNGG